MGGEVLLMGRGCPEADADCLDDWLCNPHVTLAALVAKRLTSIPFAQRWHATMTAYGAELILTPAETAT